MQMKSVCNDLLMRHDKRMVQPIMWLENVGVAYGRSRRHSDTRWYVGDVVASMAYCACARLLPSCEEEGETNRC
jgi:hypothetical protein